MKKTKHNAHESLKQYLESVPHDVALAQWKRVVEENKDIVSPTIKDIEEQFDKYPVKP